MLKTLSSSKKRFFLLSGFLAAFLIVFNFSTYLLYQRAKNYLDAELGERLRSIAVSVSHTVELSAPAELSSDSISGSLYTLLHLAMSENNLSNIVILTAEGTTVVDLGRFSEPGEANPFIELDYSAVTLARSGLSSYTGLYRSGDVYMKSAYAPIADPADQVIGMVGVEAGAGYFEVLEALRRAIVAVDLSSFFLILILGVLFYRQTRSLDRAQEAVLKGENLAAMGRMVAGIAHEIRNPLSIIKTAADRLQKKYNAGDEVFSYISEEVDELNRILTGYLDFARSEALSFSRVSLSKVLRRCLLILEPEFKNKNIEPALELPESEVQVWANDRRLEQAVLNLLINSLQAVGPHGQITLMLRSFETRAEIIVSDNGHGIDKKDIKEVIKPFFTRRSQGTGLGLSIVNTIAEEHGGAVAIDSEPGRGTKVTLSISSGRAGIGTKSKREA